MKIADIQVDSADELGELAGRLKIADAETFDEEATTCRYVQSDKSWILDHAGVRWETFFTFGATSYGEDKVLHDPAAAACCGPVAVAANEQAYC